MRDVYAYARAGVHGLDDAGERGLGADGLGVERAGVIELPLGREHAEGGDDALGEVLIHRNGAAEVAAACVLDAQEVEGGLDLAVLAAAAVQGHENYVRHRAKLGARGPRTMDSDLSFLEALTASRSGAVSSMRVPPSAGGFSNMPSSVPG